MAVKKSDVPERSEESRELVTAPEAALPAFLVDSMEELSGAGNSTDPADSALPFLGMIQSGSPQLKEESPKFIEGAKSGYLFNSASRQLWPARVSKEEPGIVVIPCFYDKKWVEWKPNRGGFAGNHDFDIEVVKKLRARKTKIIVEGKEREQIVLPNGNYIVETAYTYLLADGVPMVLGASSTALGPMREWMYYRKNRRVGRNEIPAFGIQYRLQTVIQTKDQSSWNNWKFSEIGLVRDADLFEMAKMFYKAAASGEVTVGRPDMFEEDWSSESPTSSRSDDDDSIPV